MTRWRTIGVIGGMGPAATADFLGRLVAAAGAARDEDHPRVLVDSNPRVPDRNAARTGTGPSPGPVLADMARGLVAAGAEVLAMPCNAAHGWASDVRAAVAGRSARTAPGAVFIDMIDAAVTQAAASGARHVGVLAIGATLDARLYHDRLGARGITVLEPDRAAVQCLVDRIKAGDTGPEVRAAMAAQAAQMVAAGADAIIAACTEVPLALSADDVAAVFIDATSALVAATLAEAGRPAPA